MTQHPKRVISQRFVTVANRGVSSENGVTDKVHRSSGEARGAGIKYILSIVKLRGDLSGARPSGKFPPGVGGARPAARRPPGESFNAPEWQNAF